jgi:hypothetical protein
VVVQAEQAPFDELTLRLTAKEEQSLFREPEPPAGAAPR